MILQLNLDRAQAEDLLQDIVVNIWRAASRYEAARAQPMTWLSSIARNRAIDACAARAGLWSRPRQLVSRLAAFRKNVLTLHT